MVSHTEPIEKMIEFTRAQKCFSKTRRQKLQGAKEKEL